MPAMLCDVRLEGIHHVTCITADAPANVAFYRDTLGLRLVKKTVNQDDPTVYHLFYAGDRMVHRVVFRVGSEEALDFWAHRVGGRREPGRVLLHDPEGLALELVVDDSGEEPLVASHPEIPAELALAGFAGVRAYAADPGRSAPFLRSLGFEPGWVLRGERRSAFYVYDDPPPAPGRGGAGTVHHVAWACQPEEQEAWRARVAEAGGRPTPVIDRFYFRSVRS